MTKTPAPPPASAPNVRRRVALLSVGVCLLAVGAVMAAEPAALYAVKAEPHSPQDSISPSTAQDFADDLALLPAGDDVLGEGVIMVLGRPVASLAQALDYVPRGGTVRMGPGVYKMAGKITKDGVRLIGSKGTVLDGETIEGKGALVVTGNNTLIENIACRNIAVPDKNGACVRLEGQNLTLRRVHFYDSEEGLLTVAKPGRVLIEHSRFERLGEGGQAHAIYINGGELHVRCSLFLSGRREGHEIKSRARKTTIEYSTVASLDGRDSRLIDLPSGGVAIVRQSLLVQGPNTSNWEMLSFGVEGARYTNNTLILEQNFIINDREGGGRLVNVADEMPEPVVRSNLVVGKLDYDNWQTNFRYASRSDVPLAPAPFLPPWPQQGAGGEGDVCAADTELEPLAVF